MGGFPVARLGAEDWYALIRVAERSRAQYVDQSLGYYRLHNQNMTLSHSGQIMGAALTQRYIVSSSRFAQLPGTYRARILAAYAREQWLDGDAALGRVFLQLAHEADPASLWPLTLRSTMVLGRPFWRWLMRRYWQIRAVVRKQPTASDYFLARA